MEQQEYNIEDIFKSLAKLLKLVKKNIILIISINIIFVIISIFLLKSSSYKATSTILLKNAQQSKFMNIASSLGLGGGNSSDVSFAKIKSVATSDLIIRKLLLTPVTIEGDEKLLVNHYLNLMMISKNWEEKHPELLKINFAKEGFKQDSILNKLIFQISNKNDIFENQEGLILIETNNKNEPLAFELNTNLVQIVTNFFEEIELKDKLRTKRIIDNRMDSIKTEMVLLEQQYADLNDNSFNVVKLKGLIDQKRIERELRIVNGMYIELTKQSELMNFNILNSILPIKILDYPIYPLQKKQRSTLICIILGVFIGSFVSFLIIISKRFYRKIKQLM